MSPYVQGVALIDFFKFYRKWSGGRQGAKLVIKGRPFASTFDFHLVLERECNFFYEDLGDKVAKSRQNKPLDWLQYVVGDAYALKLLDRTCGLTRHFDHLRRIVGLPLEDAIHNARLIDKRLLRLRDKPLPTRRGGKKTRVKGAIVLPPDIGIHENVAYIDEKTLYPMLIVAYNLSPETFVAKDDWRKDDIVVGPTEDGEIFHFRSRPEGLFPKAVRYDMEEREKYRRMLRQMDPKNPDYDRIKLLETLHKFLSCSYYGVTGYENFRLYSDAVRKAITFLGREALLECKKDCEKAGYHVRYSDTDSFFVQLQSDVPGEGRIIEGVVNETLRRIALRRGATVFLEAKYEAYCKRIIFVPKLERRKGRIIAAKKRYAYTDENDNLYVVGLAPRRSSTPKLTANLMLQWLTYVLVEKDVEKAIKLIREAWKELPHYSVNEIGLPRGLHQEIYKTRNPWKDGCIFMNRKYGKVFREDKRPLLVWMKKKSCGTDVVCITETDDVLPSELQPHIDWEKMRVRVLENHFKPLFQAIGIPWEDVISTGKQESLMQWLLTPKI